jgi:O-succinylbenzoate synthase
VDVVDLKGHYPGKEVDPGADPALYAMVAEEFPGAWLEDPRVDARTRIALAGAEQRVTWDAPLHAADDIDAMPITPRTVNVKPSRLGSVQAVLDLYDRIARDGLGAYGGGQYEIGPGRGQIQYLASLFHPDAPNDTSPVAYHHPPRSGLPTSPMPVAASATGFRWGDEGN